MEGLFPTLHGAWLLLRSAALGVIGETEEQVERRYGVAIEVTKNEKALREVSKAHQTKASHVVITFLDGRSHGELLLKVDKVSDLSLPEMAGLLGAGAFRGHWRENSVGLPGKRWVLGAERLFALYEPLQTPPHLYIITRELRIWLTAQQKAGAAQR